MDKKIQIIPYLTFKGNCEDAVNTYIEAFGGEVLFMSRWTENTYDKTPDQIGKVMHMEFKLGETHMSGADSFDSKEVNTDIKLMIHMESMEEAMKTVLILAEGGNILSPLQPHPEPDDGGCGSIIKDRFGYTWIITCPNPDKKN